MDFLNLDIDEFGYRKNFVEYNKICLVYSFFAICSGYIIDNISKHIQTKYLNNKHPIIMIIIQLLLITLFMFSVEYYIYPKFGNSWQSITPGLFFISIFFGMQFNLFSNLQSLSSIA
jgi:hypothetical protein